MLSSCRKAECDKVIVKSSNRGNNAGFTQNFQMDVTKCTVADEWVSAHSTDRLLGFQMKTTLSTPPLHSKKP